MRKVLRMVAIVFVCAALGGLFGGRCAFAAQVTPLTQKDLSAVLDKAAGKVVVLNFFASWCPPCREEIPKLVKLRKSFPQNKVAFMSISLDEDEAALKSFVDQVKFNYPVYRDDGSINTSLQLESIPYNMVLDTSGEVVYEQSGLLQEEDLKKLVNQVLGSAK